MSSAPTWMGRKKLPKAANGAVVSTKKTIIVPCMVINCRSRRATLGNQLQAGNCSVRPSQVDAHQPGKNHPAKSGDQSQRVILLTYHLVIQAEDML